MNAKIVLVLAVVFAVAAEAKSPQPPAKGMAAVAPKPPEWPGEQFPLPLSVKSPEDLAFKTAAEREYLVFNLLAGGKVAFDSGEWATAAQKWERLLAVPGLSPELVSLVTPWAKAARERAGGNVSAAVEAPTQVAAVPVAETPAAKPAATGPTSSTVTVTGVVTGGGSGGPGGAVVMLHRAEGPTPKPKPLQKVVSQKQKRFVPGVLAVTVGTSVRFSNDDDIFHSVFSLSKPNDFDLGLYKSGEWRDQVFDTPGPVQLLCNIHSSMSAWLYVVDTPWFGQADAGGKFTVKGVPPGQYKLSVWHPRSAKASERVVHIGAGMEPLALTVDGDKPQPAFVPDKYGKPRQPQLGY
jgi:plastocyanin